MPIVSMKPKVIEEHKPKDLMRNKVVVVHPLPIIQQTHTIHQSSQINEWEEFLSIEDEYNPSIPNEYERISKERREKNKKEDRKRRSSSPSRRSGFGGRQATSDDEENNFRPAMASTRTGTAIAPPKSLISESSPIADAKIPNINSYGASTVAAKIMARYGFKDGQGLGKQEQGISTALQVEKTSKRGGRIVHEKELKEMLPAAAEAPAQSSAPSSSSQESITEILKTPSKVILLRNMVGPGDVDDELEPEVKDECTKYGTVVTVHISEMPNKPQDETVRIFVEFERIESAVKALVDLNGRFFGGRQVKCCFYSADRYENFIFDD